MTSGNFVHLRYEHVIEGQGKLIYLTLDPIRRDIFVLLELSHELLTKIHNVLLARLLGFEHIIVDEIGLVHVFFKLVKLLLSNS